MLAQWEPDGEACSQCQTPFRLLIRRRRHCRLCGQCLCSSCCDELCTLVFVSAPVRCCGECKARVGDREEQPNEAESQVSASVVKRWCQAMALQDREDLNQLMYRGVPEPLRSFVWSQLLGVKKNARISLKLSPEPSRHRMGDETVLLLDLARMSFENKQEEQAVYELCQSALHYRPYEQGHAHLAQELLRGMGPVRTDSEACFEAILSSSHLWPADLGLWTTAFSELCSDRLPELTQLCASCHVETGVLAAAWTRTAFAGFLPRNLIFRCWDLWIVHGADVLFRLACAVLARALPSLLALPPASRLAALSPSRLAAQTAEGWTGDAMVRAAMEL